MRKFEIFQSATPHYACATIDAGDVHQAMGEALRLERISGCGGWMIRDFRQSGTIEYPAFRTGRA